MLTDGASITQTTHDASADFTSGSGIEHIWASSYSSAYPSRRTSEPEAELEQPETLNSPRVGVTMSRISHSASKSAPPRSPTHPPSGGTSPDAAKPTMRRGSSASNCFSHTSGYKSSKGRVRSQTLILRRSRRMASFDESHAEGVEADVEPGQALTQQGSASLAGPGQITARAYTGRSERLLANVGTYEQFARLSQAEQERRLTGSFPVTYPFITTSQRV